MDNNKRRKVLEVLAVGGPMLWIKPTVTTVVVPAHAQTSCQLCLTVSVTGTSSGNAEVQYQIFNQDGCVLVADNADGGLPGFEATECFALEPGTYSILIRGSGDKGSEIGVTAECCDASEVFGPDGGFTAEGEIIVAANGGCTIRELVDENIPCIV